MRGVFPFLLTEFGWKRKKLQNIAKNKKTRPSRDELTPYTYNGETEVIDNNLNPKWIKHFSVWFIFVKDLDLLFQVWNYNSSDDKDLIGQTEISLSELMLAKDQ